MNPGEAPAWRKLSSEEAAAYLGVSERALKGMRQRRVVGHYRAGHRTVVYDVRDLDAYLRGVRVDAVGVNGRIGR